MDTADNRNYGLPRRGGTKGCSTAKDRTGTSFDNLTFYEGTVPKEERLACKAFHSLPSPQIEGRRKPFVPPFFSLPMLQTVDYDYRDFIGRIFLRMLYLFFSFISDRPIIYFLLSTILLKVFFRAGRIFLVHRHSLGQNFITSSRDFNRDQSRVCFSC